MLWLKDQAPHASPRGAFSNLTLKSAAACVKATSRSSTARPQEADLPFSPCGRRWREAPDEGSLSSSGVLPWGENPHPSSLREATLSHKERGERTARNNH